MKGFIHFIHHPTAIHHREVRKRSKIICKFEKIKILEININISKKKENSFKEEVKVFQLQTAPLPILLELQSGQVNSVTPTTYSQKNYVYIS